MRSRGTRQSRDLRGILVHLADDSPGRSRSSPNFPVAYPDFLKYSAMVLTSLGNPGVQPGFGSHRCEVPVFQPAREGLHTGAVT